MEASEARREFENGRLTIDQLFDLLEEQHRTIRRLQAELERVKKRLAQYEPDIQRETRPAGPPSGNATQYSLQAEEKRRQRRRKKKKSPGRRKTRLKLSGCAGTSIRFRFRPFSLSANTGVPSPPRHRFIASVVGERGRVRGPVFIPCAPHPDPLPEYGARGHRGRTCESVGSAERPRVRAAHEAATALGWLGA
jgi:uncharacterized coiled-coil protein SlyX